MSKNPYNYNKNYNLSKPVDNTPIDVDFSAIDLDVILRSQIQNQSPQHNQNLNFNNNNSNFSRNMNQDRKVFETKENKNKEKFVYNLSQGPVEISEEDLKMIIDNVMKSRNNQEESPKHREERRMPNKSNINHVSNKRINSTLENSRVESIKHNENKCNNFKKSQISHGVNLSGQFNQSNISILNENPFTNILQTFSMTNFDDIGKISIGMISYIIEKFREVDELKTEVQNLKSQLLSKNNNNLDFRNSDKEIILYANNINLVTTGITNDLFCINSTREEIKKDRSISPQSIITPIESNFMDQINDEDFDKFLQTVKNSTIKTNNTNQFEKVANFTRGFTNNVNKTADAKVNLKFPNNNLNWNNQIKNENKEEEDEVDFKNFKLKDLVDDEFDEMLKNKKILSNDGNNFVTGKNLNNIDHDIQNNTEKSLSNLSPKNQNIPSKIINNYKQNLQLKNESELEKHNFKLIDVVDDDFDNIIKKMKNKDFSGLEIDNEFVTGNKLTNINSTNLDNPDDIENDLYSKDFSIPPLINKNNQSNIQISSEISDYEMDNFLNKNKNAKKATKPVFNPPMKTNKPKENLVNIKKEFKEKEEVIKSDFISGNQNVNFKANSRIKNLMKEMDQSEDDFKVLEEIEEEPIKKRDTIKNNLINLDNNKIQNNIKVNTNIDKKDQISINKITSSKKFRVNEFSTEKLNTKRLYSDHLKSMDSESRKKVIELNNIIPHKKFKSNQPFKIMETKINNLKSNKPTERKIVSQGLKPTEIPIIPKMSYNLSTITNCQFICQCTQDETIIKCEICEGKLIINKNNFSNLFLFFFKNNNNNNQIKLSKENLEFLSYQFKLICWKFYILSKFYEDDQLFNINNILKCVFNKFKIIFETGRRSLIMKVAEKDSSINRNMNLLLIDIKKSQNEEDHFYILEFTDGFKSVFSEIKENNPISNLINRNILITGMKVNIGLAKIDKITDDFSIYININYNSFSKADSTCKLGVNKNSKFLIKNLANLREDGGEVSLIDVIVLKKYDYFCHNFSKKENFSSDKLQKLIESFNENLSKEYESGNENQNNKNLEIQRFPYENYSYSFKIVCVDSLLYLDQLNNYNNINQFSLKTNLKPKLMKKCVIEFRIKNKEIFEMIKQGNRYQIGLLNLNPKNPKDNLKKKNDPKCLNLKASDTVLIKEIKFPLKKDNNYQNLLNELGNLTNVQTEEIEVTDYLMSNHYNGNKITHEEVSSVGAYISHLITKKEDGHNLFYLFLVNKNNNLILIKIHDENFFEFSKIINSKNVSNSFLYFKNLSFQIVYYFDKKLSTFRTDRVNEKKFDNKNIVIYLESNPYSTFKTINSTHKLHDDVNKMIKTKSNENSGKFYDEALLNEIMNSI